MKTYRLTVNSDNGFQANTDLPPEILLKKSLYAPYPADKLTCIILDLDRKAKTTDVLLEGTTSLDGFPISDAFADVMKTFSLKDIQFVPITGTNMQGYQFMFWNSDLTHDLDYAACQFELLEDMLGDIEVLDAHLPPNRDAILKVYKEQCSESVFNKLVPKNGYRFAPGFDIGQYDALRIGHFDKSFYVSERLKDALEAKGITGVNFTESNLFPTAL